MNTVSLSETIEISLRSLYFAFSAALLAMLVGIAPAIWISRKDMFHRKTIRNIITSIISTLTAVPTVVIGLFVYLLLTKKGILGALNWLYTSPGVIFGEFLLALPLVIHHLVSGLSKIDTTLFETLSVFKANKFYLLSITAKEAMPVLGGALALAFGRVIGEVGLVMMIGGNIRYVTRTITTAIALETSKGNINLAMVLGIFLLVISLLVNITINYIANYE